MDSKEQILHKQQMVSDIETDCKISTLIEHKNVGISLDEECSRDTILISSCFNMLIELYLFLNNLFFFRALTKRARCIYICPSYICLFYIQLIYNICNINIFVHIIVLHM